MGKPEPPSPPNPYQTAGAQTGTNVSTAVANSFLNNMNQQTPGGALNYDVTGTHTWTDPSTNTTYNIPRFTATQQLTPIGQDTQNATDVAKRQMAEIAKQQSGSIGTLLANGMDPSFNTQGYLSANPDVAQYAMQQGLDPTEFARQHYQQYGIGEQRAGWQSPQAGDASAITGVPKAATSFAGGGPIQSTFGDAGDITRSYGPQDDFSADRGRVEEALYGRLNPQLERDRASIEQRLADQGIRYGSQAYASAMDDYNRQSTDARLAVTSAGGQEQQRMMDMAAQRAGFQNAAQQQAYDQAQGRGSFANMAQGQQFGQNAQQAAFGNAGLAQQLAQAQSGFNAQQAGRNQYMQEAYQQRNQPINEITSLMSGSQVQSPNWMNTPQSQIPTTDFAGIMNQNFAQQSQNYQSANQNWQSLMGGLLGMGGNIAGAGLLRSDRRAKKNVEKIGSVFAYDGKLPMYEYEYKDAADGTGKRIGPMAQDVEKLDPDAVSEIGGVKHIDPRRVMGGILRAA